MQPENYAVQEVFVTAHVHHPGKGILPGAAIQVIITIHPGQVVTTVYAGRNRTQAKVLARVIDKLGAGGGVVGTVGGQGRRTAIVGRV